MGGSFYDEVMEIEKELKKSNVSKTPSVQEIDKDAKICPRCGKPLKLKHGKYGDFWGCTGFPPCNYTEQIELLTPQKPVEAGQLRLNLQERETAKERELTIELSVAKANNAKLQQIIQTLNKEINKIKAERDKAKAQLNAIKRAKSKKAVNIK